MVIRKRNEFLEDNASDDDLENGYDSEANEESRGGIAGHTNKRRRVDEGSDLSAEDSDDDAGIDVSASDDRFLLQDDQEASQDIKDGGALETREAEDGNEDNDQDVTATVGKDPKATKLERKMAKQLLASQKAIRKSGVIYISRVPPFMKPSTLKHFLSPHAPHGLGRIFLTPEDHASHTRRVKSGGNKKKSFTDGWVEFNSKREAKNAAVNLNGDIIGGKKGNFYHDDLWNMKYLKGFKWNHLTEQIANENAERAVRLREEIRKTREENRAFVEDVERSKMLEGMENKRKAKREKAGQNAPVAAEVDRRRDKMEFKQQKVKSRKETAKQEPGTNQALKMIFG